MRLLGSLPDILLEADRAALCQAARATSRYKIQLWKPLLGPTPSWLVPPLAQFQTPPPCVPPPTLNGLNRWQALLERHPAACLCLGLALNERRSNTSVNMSQVSFTACLQCFCWQYRCTASYIGLLIRTHLWVANQFLVCREFLKY